MVRSVDDHDGAAQLERTALAWQRTAIAIAANGALLIRAGAVRHLGFIVGTGSLVVLVGAALWVVSVRLYAAGAGRRLTHLMAVHSNAVLSLAASVVVLSAVDLGVAVFAR